MQDGAKAFFLDLDGTLLAGGEKQPFARDMEAIAAARARGH